MIRYSSLFFRFPAFSWALLPLSLVFMTCSSRESAMLFEFADTEVFKKAVWLFLLIIGGILFVIFRKTFQAVDRLHQNRIINKIKRDHTEAAAYADQLDLPYHKLENIRFTEFDVLVRKVSALQAIGDHTILYAHSVDAYRLMLFTELTFNAYDITVAGQADDVKRKAYHNFLLRYDAEKETVTVWSTLFSDTTDKFQKQEFLKSALI